MFSNSFSYLHRRNFKNSIALLMKHSSSYIHQPSILVAVADGSEEIEAVTIVDTLVRGGAKVTLASVNSHSLQVGCSRGINLVADAFISECVHKNWDMVVCPGGMPGAQTLRECSILTEILSKQHSEGRFIAAICAAPAVVLHNAGIAVDRKMTCYPSDKFILELKSSYTKERVVVDGNVITSQGPGTALEFSLKLVEVLFGMKAAEKVAQQMIA